jgi:hypothetical protein
VNVRGGGRRINGYDQRTLNKVNLSGYRRGFKQLEESGESRFQTGRRF